MKNFRKLLKRYFCYISDVKTDYIISVICSTLMAILNILQPLFLGKLVDSLDNGNREIKYLIIFMGDILYVECISCFKRLLCE